MTLIDKLSALAGPDREVDRDIALKKGWTQISQGWFCPPDLNVHHHLSELARYTASIDAAMTLVPEGWTVAHITQNDDKSWFAELREGFLTSYNRVAMSPINTATPAIALCIAALKARDLT